MRDLNSQHAVLEAAVLPIELIGYLHAKVDPWRFELQPNRVQGGNTPVMLEARIRLVYVQER